MTLAPLTPDLSTSLVDVRGLVKEFRLPRVALRSGRPSVKAVDGIEFGIGESETYGLVGESGSGKSTVARLLVGLTTPTAGQIQVRGQDITRLRGSTLRVHRRNVQMVFQDPYSSFDPTATLADSIAEPLRTHTSMSKQAQVARVSELLGLVGLDPGYRDRFPNQLSGGQLQRAAIARALAVEPRLIVLDEPVSALDVSTQAQVINLLEDLQKKLSISYLFIAHDLSVVEHVSDRIGVMYLGQLVESGPTEAIYERPAHPYTSGLLDSIPVPDPHAQRERRALKIRGDVPPMALRPSGCSFRTRCPFAMDVCADEEPQPFVTTEAVTVRCHLHFHGPRLLGRSVRTLLSPPTVGAPDVVSAE
ncbi:dipeptide ABC transporter ATP-binding protein [Pseudonocardia ailaonensis]|uniref:Dipeptide ABC transporter ATP-binding protein n=1 Tax=Pseudonocardia ailaonensis TaxID=367279 RepID=A0ABN2N5V2_9PSEU